MKVETNTGVNLTIVRGKTSFVSEETGVKFVCFVFARSLVSACNIDLDHDFRCVACSGYLLTRTDKNLNSRTAKDSQGLVSTCQVLDQSLHVPLLDLQALDQSLPVLGISPGLLRTGRGLARTGEFSENWGNPWQSLESSSYPVKDLESLSYPIKDLDSLSYPGEDLESLSYPGKDLSPLECLYGQVSPTYQSFTF